MSRHILVPNLLQIDGGTNCTKGLIYWKLPLFTKWMSIKHKVYIYIYGYLMIIFVPAVL